MEEKQTMSQQTRYGYMLLGVLCLMVVLSVGSLLFQPVTVSFIDVGQGDACLIRAGRGGTVLIDSGDSGAGTTLLSYFDINNVRKLDGVILSHLHDDHISGVKELMEEGFPISVLYLPSVCDRECEEKLLSFTREAGVSVEHLSAGAELRLGKADYHVLWPEDKAEYFEENNCSMVVSMEYGENRVIFTGDAELTVLAEIAKEHEDEIQADVLKVPHHGSKTSISPSFLKAVKPRVALIGAGWKNQHGHPDEETVEMLNQLGCKVLRTDLHGTIQLRYTEEKLVRLTTTDKWRNLE